MIIDGLRVGNYSLRSFLSLERQQTRRSNDIRYEGGFEKRIQDCSASKKTRAHSKSSSQPTSETSA
jgi:hypothetical protein